jgi:hypothetical protein
MTAPAPYTSDTRAKGWRFELDYERIAQSDTWDLAAEIPMAQPALLMLWMVAWQQTPCGSLPNDEQIIRAKCRIPPEQWSGMREVLLRGWWLADDGRLYHHTLVERVREMMERRRKESDRKALARARKPAGIPPEDLGGPGESFGDPDDVPGLSRGTGAGLRQESATGTGTGTSTGTEDQTSAANSVGAASPSRGARLAQDWVLPKAWGEWSVDELGMPADQVRTEAAKFRDYWCAKSGKDATKLDWQATWRNWCRNAKPTSKPSPQPADTLAKMARVRDLLGASIIEVTHGH